MGRLSGRLFARAIFAPVLFSPATLVPAIILVLFPAVMPWNTRLMAEDGKRKRVLAIMNLSAGRGVPSQLARKVTDGVRGGLVNSGLFRITERERLAEIMKAGADDDCVGPRCAVRIGRLLAAEKIVVGTVVRLGKKYYITFRIIDVESAKIDISEIGRAEDAGDLEETAEKMARTIASRVSGLDPRRIIVRKRLPWTSLAWRSALLPGWGQFADDQPEWGIAWLVLFTGTVGGAIVANFRAVDAEEGGRVSNLAAIFITRTTAFGSLQLPLVSTIISGNQDETDARKREESAFMGAAAAIYLASVVHAAFSGTSLMSGSLTGKRAGSPGLRMTLAADGVGRRTGREMRPGSRNGRRLGVEYTWRF